MSFARHLRGPEADKESHCCDELRFACSRIRVRSMERTWLGQIHSIENYFWPQIDVALRHDLVLLAYVGIMSSVDMIVSVCRGERNREGFFLFCDEYLSQVHTDYALSSNKDHLWKIRVGLTHNWVTRERYHLSPSGGLHLQQQDGSFHVDVRRLFEDSKQATWKLWDAMWKNEVWQKEADARVASLFGA